MSELLDGAKTNIKDIEFVPIMTLESLAAEGKFISATHNVPPDWISADWKFTLDGAEFTGFGVIEVYAPGGPDGWAVVYVKDAEGNDTGQTELIRGNWTIERKSAPKVKQELSEASIG